VAELLADDPARNPLMQPRSADNGGGDGDDDDDNTVRYFHLPANNMIWVEEAMARYYGEKRPDPDDLVLLGSNKLGRRTGRRTKTEMLLRHEFWRGQQSFESTGRDDDKTEVHARHMRGMCDVVSIDQVATEMRPKNLVLFMPYLHWETDRGRIQTATKIKEVSKDRLTLAELLDKAKRRLSKVPTGGTDDGPYHHNHHHHHQQQQQQRQSPPGLPANSKPTWSSTQDGDASSQRQPPRSSRRQILGDVLRAAAALLEAMEFHVEEQLVAQYLHAQPPLHPRRTLDQSYYGALKNTGTRDRDQVVYRATAPEPHEHDPCWEECVQCREDIRKIPRLIMVDQLWLWILDESTLLFLLLECLSPPPHDVPLSPCSHGVPCRVTREPSLTWESCARR
jgi:hypothetical protein